MIYRSLNYRKEFEAQAGKRFAEAPVSKYA
jgi:hypothetical protein